jgi:hypothetical protein
MFSLEDTVGMNSKRLFLRYRELEKKEERKKSVKELYNGDIIMAHFDISGVELGKKIGEFERFCGGKLELENFVIKANDITTIMRTFADVCGLIIKDESN